MSTFVRFSSPRAAREHVCEQCGKTIERGAKHSYCVAKDDDTGFVYYREHLECRQAWIEFDDIRFADEARDFLCSADLEPEEIDWLTAHHPIVAERLGLMRPESEAA